MIPTSVSQWFEKLAPLAARIIFGGSFLMGAMYKIPGTAMFNSEVAMSAGAGIPFTAVFVALAFLLEVVAGLALIVGWHARAAALTLAAFTLALAFIFYMDWSNQMIMGEFISHLGLVAGLLYVSVYGARHFAIRKDA